jgi:hypothetical protein
MPTTEEEYDHNLALATWLDDGGRDISSDTDDSLVDRK